jgi:AcrR family transcriptional regulator
VRKPQPRPSGPEVHNEPADGGRGRAREPIGKTERARRPRGTTAQKILDVALELFTERGYDNTSLREIADELGMTKAALYYHFERKEDILLALHLRLHAIGGGLLDRVAQLGNDAASVEARVTILDQYIEDVLQNPKLVQFQARNQRALDLLQHHEHQADHAHLEEQLRRITPLELRVRISCAMAAVAGVLVSSDIAFGDVPTPQLVSVLRDAVHDLMAADLPPSGSSGDGMGRAPRLPDVLPSLRASTVRSATHF